MATRKFDDDAKILTGNVRSRISPTLVQSHVTRRSPAGYPFYFSTAVPRTAHALLSCRLPTWTDRSALNTAQLICIGPGALTNAISPQCRRSGIRSTSAALGRKFAFRWQYFKWSFWSVLSSKQSYPWYGSSIPGTALCARYK